MEINNWIIEDVAWTLKNFKSRGEAFDSQTQNGCEVTKK